MNNDKYYLAACMTLDSDKMKHLLAERNIEETKRIAEGRIKDIFIVRFNFYYNVCRYVQILSLHRMLPFWLMNL